MFVRHIVVIGCLLSASASAGDDVQIEHDGLRLNGSLEGELAGEPVVLMVHGTLAHHGMELIENLQQLLAERDLPSLAITLGLGIDDRSGMYDCSLPHSHRHDDALAEIAAWLDWLSRQDQDQIVLLGHSRGGNQVARFMIETGDSSIAGGVLIAPMTWDEALSTAAYEARGAALSPLLERAAAGETLEQVPFLSCPTATVAGPSFASYYATDPRFDTPSLLSDIDLPALLIAASDDQVVPDLTPRLDEISQPNVETVVIDGADHFFIEFFADDAADAVATFVGGLQ